MEFIKNNTNWTYQMLPVLFTPFKQNDKPKLIQSLSAEFAFDKSINLKETVDGNTLKEFAVAFGFWYKKDYEISPPFLYLGIYRYKVATPILPISFYEKLEATKFTTVIYHPSKDNNQESIEMQIPKINDDEIENGFQIFKNQILNPFLEAINNETQNNLLKK